jgi:hypothetical protein
MTDDDTTPFLDAELPDLEDAPEVPAETEPRSHNDENESDDD